MGAYSKTGFGTAFLQVHPPTKPPTHPHTHGTPSTIQIHTYSQVQTNRDKQTQTRTRVDAHLLQVVGEVCCAVTGFAPEELLATAGVARRKGLQKKMTEQHVGATALMWDYTHTSEMWRDRTSRQRVPACPC